MKYSFDEAIAQLQEGLFPVKTDYNALKFIVDAQLPKKLSDFLRGKGFDSIHTLDLPDKNTTTDKYIKEIARRIGY